MSSAHPGALLLAAVLVPLLWWLHRSVGRGDPLYVASLLPFKHARVTTLAAEARRSPRADPVWMRRAALVLALAAALAGLQTRSGSVPLVVWIDGSPSMQTREQGRTRLEAGLTELTRELAASDSGEVTLRSLAQPAFVLHAAAPLDVAGLLHQLPVGPIMTPVAIATDPAVQRWLLTDGASAQVLPWLTAAPMHHVIRVGTATENAAIVGLAVRSSLQQPDHTEVLVSVRNAGSLPATRHLELHSQQQLDGTDLMLVPGQTRVIHFTVGRPPLRLSARLTPGDSLAGDDTLDLNVPQPLAIRVADDSACGAALETALRAHPGVLLSDAAHAQLLVDCSGHWPRTALPRLVQVGADSVTPTAAPGYWSSELLQLSPLPAGIRAGSAPLAMDVDDEPILSAGNRVLAVLRAQSPRRVDTSLDLQDGQLAARSDYPVLLADLLNLAYGESLLGRTASAARAAGAVGIAPDATVLARLRAAPGLASAAPVGTVHRDWTLPALLLGLALMIWESVATVRAWQQRRRYYLGLKA